MYPVPHGTNQGCTWYIHVCTWYIQVLRRERPVQSNMGYIHDCLIYVQIWNEYVRECTWYLLVHTILYLNLNAEPCITGFCGLFVCTNLSFVYTGTYTVHTNTCSFILTTWMSMFDLDFFSTFEELKLPINGPWKILEWSSFMNRSQHHVSTWLPPRTWWAESPWSRAFWMATRPQQSLTRAARTGIRVSWRVVQTRLQRMMDGVSATSMRLTVTVNTWLWMFRRGKPRLGGLTIRVEETSHRQGSACKASDKRRMETRERRNGDGAW